MFDYSLDAYMNSFFSTTKTSSKYVELKDGLRIDVDIPGVKKPDVKISQDAQVLTIKACRDKRDFFERFIVRDDYDLSTTKASLEDGVLSLIVKKRNSSCSRDVPIT